MPIDLDFPKNHQVIGKHSLSDDEHYHYVWGPGRAAEATENEEVKAAFAHEEKNKFHSEFMAPWLQ